LRPDHLQRNGYFRSTAPHLEKLLDESVVFSDVYTPLARTYPSWIATLTGLLPINNGIRDNIISDLIPKNKTVTQAFQEAGWHTSFITDDSRFSFMQEELGFDYILQPEVGAMNFALSASEPRFRAFHGLMHNKIGYWLAPVVRHNQALGKSYRPELFFEATIEALHEASQNERFFLTSHSCFLHAPGDRNYPWSRMHGQKGYRGKNRFRYSRSGSKIIASEVGDDEPVYSFAQQDERIYDSGIAMADGIVERIVGELKKSGLYDNTVIIVFSDHGENMWKPNLPYKWHGPNHGFHPYDDGQHKVVLGIRFPDQEFAGTQIDNPVRLIDLAPTLVEYFQLPWEGDFDGESLFPLMRGEEEEKPRMVYIETGMSEKNYWPEGHRDYPYKRIAERYWIEPDTKRVLVRNEFLPHLIAGKDRTLQMGQWKLVFRPMKGEPMIELFDRQVDPHNRDDVSLNYPVHTAYLGMKMLEFLERDSEELTIKAEWEKIIAENPEPNWWGEPEVETNSAEEDQEVQE